MSRQNKILGKGLGSIFPGKRVCTLKGETDTAHNGNERQTSPGTWGHVTALNHADHWNVGFPNGAWVVITEGELADPQHYRLAAPETLEQCALALQHGQEVMELSMLDDEMMAFTQVLAGNPEQILKIITENQALKTDALEMVDVIRTAWDRWDRYDQADAPKLGEDLERIACTRHAWEPATAIETLKPITSSGELKSISDDDLCATCACCQYRPGELSSCVEKWPGRANTDGYVMACISFDPRAQPT